MAPVSTLRSGYCNWANGSETSAPNFRLTTLVKFCALLQLNCNVVQYDVSNVTIAYTHNLSEENMAQSGETCEAKKNISILLIMGESDVLFWVYSPFRWLAICYKFGYQSLKSFLEHDHLFVH